MFTQKKFILAVGVSIPLGYWLITNNLEHKSVVPNTLFSSSTKLLEPLALNSSKIDKNYLAQFQEALGIADSELKFKTLVDVLTRWAEANQTEALSVALSALLANDDDILQASIVHSFKAEQLNRLMNSLAQQLEKSGNLFLLPKMVKQWAAFSAIDSLNWVRSLPHVDMQLELARIVFDAWIDTKPEFAIQHILSQKDAALNPPTVAYALKHWVDKDPDAASAFLVRSDLRNQNDACEVVITSLAHLHPEKLLPLVSQLPMDQLDHELILFNALAPLFQKDPTTGKALLMSVENIPNRLLHIAADEFVKASLSGAVQWLTEINSDAIKIPVGAGILPVWANQDPQAARNWLMTQTTEIQQALIPDLVKGLGNTDPQGSVQLITATLPPSAAGATILQTGLMKNWVTKDDQSARSWAKTLPASEEKVQIYGDIAQAMMQKNSEQAKAWINSLPRDTEEYKQAVYSAAYSISEERKPIDAINFVVQQIPTGQQDARLHGLLDNWLKDDRKAAIPWIEKSKALSDEEKKELLKNIKRD